MKSKMLVFAVILAALFTTACPSRTTIGKIQADPGKYTNKDVVLAGNVTNSYGVPLVGGIYKLDDGTGSIWVLASRGVPSKGAQVGVKGRLQEGVNFGGRNYGLGIVEDERRSR